MVMLLCWEAWIDVTVMFRNSWRWHSRGFGSFSLWIRGLYHCMKAVFPILFRRLGSLTCYRLGVINLSLPGFINMSVLFWWIVGCIIVFNFCLDACFNNGWCQMTFRRGFMNMWSLSWYDGCLLRDVVYHDVSRFTFHGVYVMTPTGKWNILWEWPGFPTVATSWVNRAAASVIHCMPKNSLQASVCVFSDRMMAHQHLEFVAGQRVCFFWPHDGASAAVIHCTRSRCSIRNS